MLHIVRYLLQNGARPSINQTHNSALACVLRHITDWEFRYDLLHMLLEEGGDPNVEGRDGSVPLMVCLVPLINKDPLHHFTHTMKVRKKLLLFMPLQKKFHALNFPHAGVLPELRADTVQVRRQPELLLPLPPDPASRARLHGFREHLSGPGAREGRGIRVHTEPVDAAVAGARKAAISP